MLMASKLPAGPAREALIRSVRGLAGGRAGTCTLLIAGLLALSGHAPDRQSLPVPARNDLLETFVPDGWPGSETAASAEAASEFASKFETAARRIAGGVTCAAISGVDWLGGKSEKLDQGYPPAKCIVLADAAVEELDGLLARTAATTGA
jgi:hypothetical protein